MKTADFTKITGIPDFPHNFVKFRAPFVNFKKLYEILRKCKNPTPRPTVLRKSAQTLINLRKYIPSGGVDSHRNY